MGSDVPRFAYIKTYHIAAAKAIFKNLGKVKVKVHLTRR